MIDLSLIEKEYNLQISDFLLLSPKRKIYKLQTDKGNFVLKPLTFPVEEFSFINEACDYLFAQECNVCHIIKNIEGKLFLEDQNQEKYFLMNYVEGKSADFTDYEQIELIAGALADVHKKSKGFHCTLYQDRNKIGDFINNVNNKINDMEKWQRMLSEKNNLCYFDFLYMGYVAKYINDALRVYENLQDYYANIAEEYKNRGCICHHDLANHNIMIAGENVGLVDFDYCISDIFVHDLASILLRLGKANFYDCNLPLKFLKTYIETLPLGKEEARLLWDYLCFPQGFWQLGLAFYEELSRIDDIKKQKVRRGRLDKRLTDYIDTEESRKRFLQELRAQIL